MILAARDHRSDSLELRSRRSEKPGFRCAGKRPRRGSTSFVSTLVAGCESRRPSGWADPAEPAAEPAPPLRGPSGARCAT